MIGGPIPVAVAVTLVLSLCGLMFHAGRVAARIDSLEAWRNEMRGTLDAVHAAIRRVEDLIRNGG